jgi:hypothetical protein
MGQVNLKQTITFTAPPDSMLGLGYDEFANLCRINSDGSKTIIPIGEGETGFVPNIVANLGIGIEGNLPTVITQGDIYVTTDTLKVYTAQDSMNWSAIDLIKGQFVTNGVTLYQYNGATLYQVISGITDIGYTFADEETGVIVVGTISDSLVEFTGAIIVGIKRSRFSLYITHDDTTPVFELQLSPYRAEFDIFTTIAFNGSNIELSYDVGTAGDFFIIKGKKSNYLI